ncbi:hypothetical protein WJX74_001548 [Apatococcus lobatus]|uniref:Uncharacterized protein n=1 Tax=Apatococcus lobatus TaxID=904363 RepID=A0AAW1SEW4_9CHLO
MQMWLGSNTVAQQQLQGCPAQAGLVSILGWRYWQGSKASVGIGRGLGPRAADLGYTARQHPDICALHVSGGDSDLKMLAYCGKGTERCQTHTMNPLFRPRSSPAPLLPLTKGNLRFYTGISSQQRSGPSPGRYGSTVDSAPSHLPRPGSTCYLEEGPRASQVPVTAVGQEAVFLLEGDDGRPQRVGRELDLKALEEYRLGLPVQGQVWSALSEGCGIMQALAEEEKQEPVEGLAAAFAHACRAERDLHGVHGHEHAAQEPQRVVFGFHVVQGAAADVEKDHQRGDSHHLPGIEEGVGEHAADDIGANAPHHTHGDHLQVLSSVHELLWQGPHKEPRQMALDGAAGAGMGPGHGITGGHVHDLFDVQEFQGEELQRLSAYVDDTIQDGGGAPERVEADHDGADEAAGCLDARQDGALQYDMLMDIFEAQWSGCSPDPRALRVRLADAAAAFRRWLPW